MNIHRQKKWTVISLLGLAYWFFGNLYEEIVFAPNWVVDSASQLKRLHDFFINTSPTMYFMPITQLASIAVWMIWWLNKVDIVKRDYRTASLFILLATLLNVFIVSTIVAKLFALDLEKHGEYLTTLCWQWNILNVLRMVLVYIAIHHLFNGYRKLERMVVT